MNGGTYLLRLKQPTQQHEWGPDVEDCPDYCHDVGLMIGLLNESKVTYHIHVGRSAVAIRQKYGPSERTLASGSKSQFAALLCKAYLSMKPEETT